MNLAEYRKTPYRTLFFGILRQRSALSVGGNRPHQIVDNPLSVDGAGRYLIRGTTIAGALIDTARKLGYSPSQLEHITGKGGAKEEKCPSHWRCYHAHLNQPLEDPIHTELRQGVAIDPQTGISIEKALFNYEVIPYDTQWCFLLECEPTSAAIARTVLQKWQRGQCWIGRAVARGTGWMQLEELQQIVLTGEDLLSYPNSRKDAGERWDWLQTHPDRQRVAPQRRENTVLSAVTKPDNPPWHTISLQLILSAGEAPQGYGVDGLSLGGHHSELVEARWGEQYLQPRRREPIEINAHFEPDHHFATTRGQPFIPGSSIRGVVRHALQRLAYQDRAAIALLQELLGTTEQSARLLIRDAHLDTAQPWQVAWLQHHAEDEFAGGVYGSAKFDRLVLLQGTFRGQMVIEAPSRELAERYLDRLLPVQQLGEASQLPIGGNQWRGMGWLGWTIEPLESCEE